MAPEDSRGPGVEPSGVEPSTSLRRRGALLALVLVVVVGASGYWAGRATVGRSTVPEDLDRSALTVDVTRVSVGRELALNVSVSRPRVPLAVNSLAGVVTSVSTQPRTGNGGVLYRVAGSPVRAVEGSVPFYRSLGPGDRGPDVRQLRDALVSLGHMTTTDDIFDAATQAGVAAWQRDLGIAATGTVRQGELVAVPAMPASIDLDTATVFTGALLAGGETLVYGAVGTPRFTLIVSADQARLIPETAQVTIPVNGRDFRAVVAGSSPSPSGEVRFRLTARDGGAVCGTNCDALTEAQSSILSSVEVVQKVTGAGVPVAAITTAADGTTSVLVAGASTGGGTREVEVLASQDGVAVVRGVEVGEQVKVFSGESATSSEPTPAASPTRGMATHGHLHVGV